MDDYNLEQSNKAFLDMDKELHELREKYRIKKPLTKEEAEQIGRCAKEGDIWSRNPEVPNNPKDAFRLFVEYYAQEYCIVHYGKFIEQYKVVNEASIKAELAELDKWKNEAQKENYAEACKQKGKSGNNRKYEYLRLINGFYDGYCMTWQELRDSSISAIIYGQYVLLYERLQKMLTEFQRENIDCQLPEVPFIGTLINSNTKISDRILDAYYNIAKQPTDEEKLLQSPARKRHRYIEPYNHKIYGCYIHADDMERLYYKRNNKIKPYNSVSYKQVEDALKKWGYGYKKGYFNFENDLLGGKNSIDIIENHHLARIVFDYAYGSLFRPGGGWPESYGDNRNIFEVWHETGIEAGRYYRAWYIIIEYYFVFEPLFDERIKTKGSTPTQTENSNDFTLNTINEYVEDWQNVEFLRSMDTEHVKNLFYAFFMGKPLPVVSEIFIKNNSKKKFAADCGKLYQAFKNEPLSYDYLLLLKSTFSIFSKEDIDIQPLNRTNLYKYCTSKTQ